MPSPRSRSRSPRSPRSARSRAARRRRRRRPRPARPTSSAAPHPAPTNSSSDPIRSVGFAKAAPPRRRSPLELVARRRGHRKSAGAASRARLQAGPLAPRAAARRSDAPHAGRLGRPPTAADANSARRAAWIADAPLAGRGAGARDRRACRRPLVPSGTRRCRLVAREVHTPDVAVGETARECCRRAAHWAAMATAGRPRRRTARAQPAVQLRRIEPTPSRAEQRPCRLRVAGASVSSSKHRDARSRASLQQAVALEEQTLTTREARTAGRRGRKPRS